MFTATLHAHELNKMQWIKGFSSFSFAKIKLLPKLNYNCHVFPTLKTLNPDPLECVYNYFARARAKQNTMD